MSLQDISARKTDMLYLIFFVVHLVVMLNVDLYALYPVSLRPEYMTRLRTYYITTYNDQFFVSPPAWFKLYLYFELLFHIPMCLWAIPALWRDDPRTPIFLLMYAVQTAVTTSTCIVDYMSWTTVSSAEKRELGKLYLPYLAVSVFMGWDMVRRLNKVMQTRGRQGRKLA